jgi:hypothetical protein
MCNKRGSTIRRIFTQGALWMSAALLLQSCLSSQTVDSVTTSGNGIAASATSTTTSYSFRFQSLTTVPLTSPVGSEIEVRTLLTTVTGAPISGAAISWAIESGDGALNTTSSTTSSGGVAVVRWTLGSSPNVNQIRAVATGTGTELVFTTVGSPNAATQIEIVSGDSQSVARGGALPQGLFVRVKDSFGNLVPNAIVEWSVVTGGGSLRVSSSASNTFGISSNNWTLGMIMGLQTVQARLAGAPSASVQFSSTGLPTPASLTLTFSSADEYEYNSERVEFLSGKARLKSRTYLDQGGTTSGFGGGALFGNTTWDSNRNVLRLSNATANLTANSNWTPEFQNIVAYWRFDNSAAPTIGIHTPTMVNAPTYETTARVGSHNLRLNGSNQYANIPAHSDFTFGSGDFAISYWYRPNANCSGWANTWGITRFKTGGEPGQNSWAIGNCGPAGNTNAFSFSIESGTTMHSITSPTLYTTGAWYHLLGTRIGPTLFFYVNGELQGTANVGTASINEVNRNLRIGFSDMNSLYTNGSFDEVMIWKGKGLQASAIQHLYLYQSSRRTGVYTSRTFESFDASLAWTQFNWRTSLPFLKGLPDDNAGVQQEQSSNYPRMIGTTGSTTDNNSMNGLVGLYHFDEPAGTTGANSIRDDSGLGRHGTPSGTITFGRSGLFHRSASFTGTNAAISFPAFTWAPTSFSVSFWMNPNQCRNWNSVLGSAQGWGGFVFHTSATCEVYVGTDAGTRLSNVNLPANTVTRGEWQHFVFTYQSGLASFYKNGVLLATRTGMTAPVAWTGFRIGAATADTLDGRIDEVSLWSRALSQEEVLQMYRRGGNRIYFQLRVCGVSDCSDDPQQTQWRGPDGTAQSYFSEVHNSSTPTTSDGLVLPGAPFIKFSDFSQTYTGKRYFQYRTIMHSDAVASNCDYGAGLEPCQPELVQASVDPSHFPSGESITAKTGMSYYSLSLLTQTLGVSCASGLRYSLGVGTNSADVIWYYWSAGSWRVSNGTVGQSNTLTEVNSNLSSFGSTIGEGQVFIRAFLNSNGTSNCEIDALKLDVLQ